MKSILFILAVVLSSSSAQAERPRSLAGFSILPKKTINTAILGTNAFCNDPRFGSVQSQLNEVKNTLRLRFVRVLFAWNDQIQPTPDSSPNFSFYDDIASHIPVGTGAVAVLTGLPSWMKDPKNWIKGDPRQTFVEKWVKPVSQRYARTSRLSAFQIWNEPNDRANPDNITLRISDDPSSYVKLLAAAYPVVKQVSPRKRVVSAATTAINQSWPRTINYNRGMIAAGIERYCDIFGMHYYSEQIENVLRPKGVRAFARGLTRPIWITESGARGTVKQLSYGRRVWPFLTENIRGIRRIYQYQFTEATPASTTYGLRNLTPGQELSDLYIFLRDR